MKIFTPDDIMEGTMPKGNVVVYDDDHYYMGGIIAELLAQQGCEVILVTPSPYVSEWSKNTLEQTEIQKRLIEMGVKLELNKGLIRIYSSGIITNCIYSQKEEELETKSVVIVASRKPNDKLYQELKLQKNKWQEFGLQTVKLIGDANAPGPIAWATYAGHRYARELDKDDIGDALPFRREITNLSAN
jgi:dimethylamine/trimethylamine dehydrogenase